MSLDDEIEYSYVTTYNLRPNETHGMGKETVERKGKGTTLEFLEIICSISKIKHESCKEFIISTRAFVDHEDWKYSIGQPMYYITDIKISGVDW